MFVQLLAIGIAYPSYTIVDSTFSLLWQQSYLISIPHRDYAQSRLNLQQSINPAISPRLKPPKCYVYLRPNYNTFGYQWETDNSFTLQNLFDRVDIFFLFLFFSFPFLSSGSVFRFQIVWNFCEMLDGTRRRYVPPNDTKFHTSD